MFPCSLCQSDLLEIISFLYEKNCHIRTLAGGEKIDKNNEDNDPHEISKLSITTSNEELKARGMILGVNKLDLIARLNKYLDSANNGNKGKIDTEEVRCDS